MITMVVRASRGERKDETTVAGLLVVFRVGVTCYGIAIDAVEEILPEREVARLPRAPRGMTGVVDVRSRVVPVYDLHARFGVYQRQSTPDSRMVLVKVKGDTIALPVDGVDEVASIDTTAVQTVELPGKTGELKYLVGVVQHRGQLVLWIDPERLFPQAARRTRRLARAA